MDSVGPLLSSPAGGEAESRVAGSIGGDGGGGEVLFLFVKNAGEL